MERHSSVIQYTVEYQLFLLTITWLHTTLQEKTEIQNLEYYLS
jgi:hypothetical protein